jgi:cytochrome P450
MGWFESYVLSSPEYIQHVLIDHPERYGKGPIFEKVQSLIGKGLITSETEVWRRNRRLVQPLFHPRRLNSILRLATDVIDQHLAQWHEKLEPIDLANEMTKLTMNVICAAIFGRQSISVIESLATAGSNFVDEVGREILTLFHPLRMIFPKKIQIGPATAKLRKVIYDLIEERRSEKEVGTDFLSQLLASRDSEGKGLSDQELLDEVLTLFVAGHETTALGLTWTLMALAQHPEKQNLAYKEIISVTGESAKISLDNVGKLSYPRMIVEEALRLYPPVWSIPRQAIVDDEIGGFKIPRGSFVALSPYIMHHHPTYWAEPEKFIPERFAKDREPPLKTVYFPFGVGARHCIGSHLGLIEMQLIVAKILQKFELSLVSEEKVGLLPHFTLKPDRPIKIILKPKVHNESNQGET